MKNQLKAGAGLSYVALLLNSLISILYTPIMLAKLGQSEYGLFSLANSTIGFIAVLNFGLGNALIRYTAKYKALNDEAKCSQIYGMFFMMYLILGMFALGAGITITMNSDTFFSNTLSLQELEKIKILMAIVTVNISLGIGFGIFSVILLAYEKFIFQRVISIIGSLINPLVMLPLLFLGYRSITMVIVTTIINLVVILFNMFYCFKILKIKIVFKRVEIKLFKEIIIFSSYIFVNLAISKLYESTDQFILGIYSGTVAISIYTIGALFSGYFSGFSSAISNVFLTKVTTMATKDGSNKEMSDLFIRIGRVQYIIISFALSGFIVFGQEFIIIWVGEDYRVSFFIALIILVPLIVSLIQTMGGVILQATNRQRFKTIMNAFVAIINVILSVILVQRWGPIGCAIGTAAAFIIGNIIIMNIYYWKKIKINIPKFWLNIVGMSGPLGLSIAFGLTLNKMVMANGWGFLIIKMLLFSTAYLIVMWITSMNKYEKDLLLIPIKRISHRLVISRTQ